jgi:hypothetical protein
VGSWEDQDSGGSASPLRRMIHCGGGGGWEGDVVVEMGMGVGGWML